MGLREKIAELYDRNDENALAKLWYWAKEPEKENKRHARWAALAAWASDKRSQAKHQSDERAEWARVQGIYEGKVLATQPDQQPDVPGIEDGGWHPGATRNQVHGGIGAFLNVPAKLVWHTTEGTSLPGYSGSHPHFTLDPRDGKLYQHISIKSGAMTLKNLSGGVETNRAHALQVELIGRAAETDNWPLSHYVHLAKLARWIEKHAGVARKTSVTFTGTVHHVSESAWLSYSGHIGHQHVPENDHWDPGSLRIGAVL